MRRTLALLLTVATTSAGLTATTALAAPVDQSVTDSTATHIVVLEDDAAAKFSHITAQLRDEGINISREWPGLGMLAIEASDAEASKVAKIDGVKGTGKDSTFTAPPVVEEKFDEQPGDAQPDADPNDAVDGDARLDSETRRNVPWGLDRIDQQDNWLDGTYTAPNNGEGVTAYIVDSGVDPYHPEFRGRIKPGYDFVEDDAVAQDEHGHGTHVAGTVGGTNFGVANDVTIVPVRVLNETAYGSGADIVDGIDWVRRNHSGPSVANISIGSRGPNWWLDEAATRLVQSGVFVSVSAMNWDIDACDVSPARQSAVLTVGATTKNDQRANYSDWGQCVDIMAPGSNILSARVGGGSMYLSGTSMAAPHVTGVAAQYLSLHPNASPAEISQKLTDNAVRSSISDLKGSPNLLLNNSFLNVERMPLERPDTDPRPGDETSTYTVDTNAPVTYSDSVKATFNVSQDSVSSIDLGLDITHACQEDLQISVTTPEGSRTVAKRPSWSWTCTPWTGMQTETFAVSSSSAGEWAVDVKDYRHTNDGTVRTVQLTVGS